MPRFSQLSSAQRLIYNHSTSRARRGLRNEILTLIFMITGTVFAYLVSCSIFFAATPSERLLTDFSYLLFIMIIFSIPVLLLVIMQIRCVFRAYKAFRYAAASCTHHPLESMTPAELQTCINDLQEFGNNLNQTINSLTEQQRQLRRDFQQQDAELQQQIDDAKQTLRNQNIDGEIKLRQQLLALHTRS